MVITYILFILGIYILIKSADWIVDGASSLAKRLGVSSLIVGLTVVAFGTSLPELIVNIFAALNGAAEVSFGNIVGSNIANILLVLGITATIASIKIKSNTTWKQIPFALLAAFVFFILVNKDFFGGTFLTWKHGIILLTIFAAFLYYILDTARKDKKKHIGFPEDSDEPNLTIGLKLAAGLIGIYLGGQWVVDGAVLIASQLGLSQFLISATIIAIGTSLPELVVSITAVLKKNADLAVGNIVGSNIFNILWVFGIIPFIAPIKIPAFVSFDIAIMFLVTLMLFVFIFIGRKYELSRKTGIAFVLSYLAYIAYIIIRG
jgi:cation:H+ antiporter